MIIQTKRTIRRFVLSVPTGDTIKQQVRTFVRDVNGTEWPVDRDIDVPAVRTETFDVELFDGSTPSIQEANDAWAEAKFAGARCLSCQDFVTLIPVEVPDPPAPAQPADHANADVHGE